MRIAALDVGSNSFHLIVADVGTGGHINVLDRAKEMVRLGDSTLHHGVIPPEVFRRGPGRPARASPHRRSPQRRRADGGRDQRRARGAERRRVRARGARRGGHRHPGHPRRRGGAAHLPGRARLAGPRQAAGGAVRSRRRLARGHPRRRAGALLHGLAEAGRHPAGRDAAPAPIRRRRASARSWRSASRSMLDPVDRARARDGLRLRRVHVGDGVRAGQRAARRQGRGQRQVDDRAQAIWRRWNSGWGRCRSRRARGCPGSTRGAPTPSTRARSCSGPRSSWRAPSEATLCETALREGIIADYVASNRPGILLVDEFPDLRRRTRDGAGPPLPVPRGPRHARGAAGAVDLRPDAPAAQAGRRATASCSSTRRCCTTSASTSRPTATTGTAPT